MLIVSIHESYVVFVYVLLLYSYFVCLLYVCMLSDHGGNKISDLISYLIKAADEITNNLR